MGLISCFIKTTVAILSITPSLSAHVLHTESITSRAVTPDEPSGHNYQFKFLDAQGNSFSEEDAAGINVFHYNHYDHQNNSAKTSLQKRSTMIDRSQCREFLDEMNWSSCSPQISARAWEMECVEATDDRLQIHHTPYIVQGTCLDSEICVERQGAPYQAFCVSLEDFVHISLTRSRGDDQTFRHDVHDVVGLPANAAITLRATDSKTNADIRIAHLEMSAQHCERKIGNVDQCATVQNAACDYCMTDVLRLTKPGANRIKFLARFFRPGINLYLGVIPSV